MNLLKKYKTFFNFTNTKNVTYLSDHIKKTSTIILSNSQKRNTLSL